MLLRHKAAAWFRMRAFYHYLSCNFYISFVFSLFIHLRQNSFLKIDKNFPFPKRFPKVKPRRLWPWTSFVSLVVRIKWETPPLKVTWSHILTNSRASVARLLHCYETMSIVTHLRVSKFRQTDGVFGYALKFVLKCSKECVFSAFWLVFVRQVF